MRSIHLPFARWVTSFLSTFFLLLPSAHAARDFMHKKRLRLWFIHVIHRFIHNMLITLFITVDNSPQKIAMLPWNADTVEVPVMWIVWITRNGAQGVDSANSFFIKKQIVSYACHSLTPFSSLFLSLKTKPNEIFHKNGKSRLVIPFDSIGRKLSDVWPSACKSYLYSVF